jgi:hypothetical protein
MNIFIWERVDNMSYDYHSNGGLVVIARDLDRAREMIKEKIRPDCEALEKQPDFVSYVQETEEKIFDFPDSGCC